MKAIILQETRQGCAIAEKEPRYNVVFRGKLFCQLYYNLRGYVGNLPAPKPDGTPLNLTIGEKSISAYKKEIVTLNKEWAKYEEVND